MLVPVLIIVALLVTGIVSALWARAGRRWRMLSTRERARRPRWTFMVSSRGLRRTPREPSEPTRFLRHFDQ